MMSASINGLKANNLHVICGILLSGLTMFAVADKLEDTVEYAEACSGPVTRSRGYDDGGDGGYSVDDMAKEDFVARLRDTSVS